MKRKQTKSGLIKFNPVAASILLALPFMAQSASIDIKNGTINNANGVPVININTANGNGISHNIYNQLNVGKEGVIFNNSQSGANTVLGGQIAGNSQLTTGSAKVILNEVVSTSQSALNGFMEVGGDKAHLIIANPNGITTQNSGFINTEKATLTTGKPDMQDGKLKGYTVSKGTVTVKGLKNASPTEILARSVVVEGQLHADQVAVVAGHNYVNTDAKVVGAVAAQGPRVTQGIDVARLGGMYANRISLISTENGVGVRNAGMLASGTAGIHIDSNGRLINNNGNITSAGDLNLKTNGVLENTTGKIIGEKKIYIDTAKNAVVNTRAGNISAVSDIYVDSGAFDNTNGKIASGNLLAMNTNGQTLVNSGKGNTVGIEAGVVALQTGLFNNSNGQIHSYYVGAQTSGINNSNGIVESYGDVDLFSTGDVNNTRGLVRSSTGRVQISADRTLINSNTKSADTASLDSLGILAGNGGIKITAGTLNNRGGQIASDKDIALESKGAIDNYNGKVNTFTHISVKGNTMDNSQGGLSGKQGVKVELTGNFDNRIGAVGSEEGDVELKANRVNNNNGLLLGENINIQSASSVDNSYALMVANKKLTISAQSDFNNYNGERFGQVNGIYFGMPDQKGGVVAREGVDIKAHSINNDNSRIIAEHGPLKIETNGSLSNNRALLVSGGGDSQIKANRLSNNYSTIYSAGNLTLDTGYLSNLSNGTMIDNNATGIIASDKKLGLNIGSAFINYGWINGKGDTAVNVKGALYNRNTISSDANLGVVSSGGLTNYKDISAGEALSVNSGGLLSNNRDSNISAKVTVVKANDVINYGNIVADDLLMVDAGRYLYNYSNMFTNGYAIIKANSVTNSGNNAVLGGLAGTELNADRVSGSGIIVGM